ncbi:hypothetical protein G4228_015378 [Cervus hanglu yarkandensis]|nr:hypothetical protein G4228_015378 [Cervus hanglu yarkandensis]
MHWLPGDLNMLPPCEDRRFLWGLDPWVCVQLETSQLFWKREHSILLSIVALGRTLRGAVAGGRRGALEKAAWTVAVRTEAVMRRHCRKLRQRSWRPETRPSRRPGGRRRLLLRALDAVATCWEKLFALRAAATDGSWGS